MNAIINKLFNLDGRVAVITGGAGMLGVMHAEIIAAAGACPILADINGDLAESQARRISKQFKVSCSGLRVDIADKYEIKSALKIVLKRFKRVDILINNAANNPKVNKRGLDSRSSRLENFSIDQWNQDISVGLTGAFLCSQVIGREMARKKGGVILNISSDLGIIAPDQRIYRKKLVPDIQQQVKPVSYSVVKTGLIGLTRYLATYWADKNVRVNAICPGGVENNQSKDFIKKLTNLIPLGRMAKRDEYKGAVLFLISDASSYMTGTTLVIDGGRSCW